MKTHTLKERGGKEWPDDMRPKGGGYFEESGAISADTWASLSGNLSLDGKGSSL